MASAAEAAVALIVVEETALCGTPAAGAQDSGKRKADTAVRGAVAPDEDSSLDQRVEYQLR